MDGILILIQRDSPVWRACSSSLQTFFSKNSANDFFFFFLLKNNWNWLRWSIKKESSWFLFYQYKRDWERKILKIERYILYRTCAEDVFNSELDRYSSFWDILGKW